MIPARKGKMTQSQIMIESIYDFTHNLPQLKAVENDGLNDEQIEAIYTKISINASRASK